MTSNDPKLIDAIEKAVLLSQPIGYVEWSVAAILSLIEEEVQRQLDRAFSEAVSFAVRSSEDA